MCLSSNADAVAGLSVLLLVSIVIAQGGPVNDHEPTEWCTSCATHDSGTSNNPYWSHFPNGDNPRFGLFRLGHRWQAGTYDAAWNADFSISRTLNFENTPLRDSITQWTMANNIASVVAHLSELWPAMCPLDSDGDGFSNGVELGDPHCTYPGTSPRKTGLSDPNNVVDVPPISTTTASPSPNTTTTAKITASSTTTFNPSTTAIESNEVPVTSRGTTTASSIAPTIPVADCTTWHQYSIVAGDNETTFTAPVCVGRGAADPHYETVDDGIVTCDNLGWSTLIESSQAVVQVRHVPVGSSTVTAIDLVRYLWKDSNRAIEFGTTPNASTTSDNVLVANSNGVTDYEGRNYVEVQSISTIFGTFLNVQVVFAEPTSGILVRGCPEGSPAYDSRNVVESPACSEIVDKFSRYACNVDVQRIGTDDFVLMAKASEAQRNQVRPTTMPSNGGSVTVTRKIESNKTDGLDPAILNLIGVFVGIAVTFIAVLTGVIVYVRRREKVEAAEREEAAVRAAQASHATHYMVGRVSESEASTGSHEA